MTCHVCKRNYPREHSLARVSPPSVEFRHNPLLISSVISGYSPGR